MNLLPTVLVDSREKRPLAITGFPTRVETLPCGDYGLEHFSDWTNPAFVIERKSVRTWFTL
jgi:ERCC4-type nuclease